MIKPAYLYFIFLLFPCLAFADSYAGDQGAAQMLGDYVTDFWDFFETDIPDFVVRLMAYAFEQYLLIWLGIKLEAMKLGWAVAKQILQNLEFASQVTSRMNALPNDVRAALVDLRIMDCMNIIANAYVARFVMRFI
ncbi:DUF2523 family protein [Pseudoalteromonas sp. T1lg22]|uniref:DUF2523 family protein n=1 Tax=Pseudoalteromonas sp. T1lg22 TaxID=2077096 RepID=UPI000CF73037|nr:DUF2523 family protein [Pseudoalteromonas sp. T1lg22]